jgi:predicted RNA-binding protein associated with RNAse of E/G family
VKRKYGDRADWARILERSFTVARVEQPAFCGVVTLYSMRRVRAPLFKAVAGELARIADDGFRWLRLYFRAPGRPNLYRHGNVRL